MLQTRYYFTDEFTAFDSLLKAYRYRTVSFEKGALLKSPAEKFIYNYYVQKGFCKVSVVHDSGAEKVIGFWGPGSVYPIICAEQNFILEHSIVVTAISEMTTLAFGADETKKIMADHPQVAYEMIDHYCKFTNLLFFLTTAQTFDDIKTRVCTMLFVYYQNSGTDLLSLTQSELASIIGARRESVVKVLKELRAQKIIETTKNQIHILSLEKLMHFGSLLLQ